MSSQNSIDPTVDEIISETIPGARTVRTGARQSRVAASGEKPPKSSARKAADPAPKHTRKTGSHKTKNEELYTFVDFLKDYRTHLGVGIVLCLMAFATVVCGISFLFNHGLDQSVTHGRSISEIVEAGDVVQNAGGPVGSKLAEWLLVDSFGIGAFVLAVYVFLLGLAVMHVKKCSFWSLTFRCLFTAAALSVIVGLLTYNEQMSFNLGGGHGLYINRLLLQYTDALGAYCVMVALIGLLIAVYLNPIKRLFAVMGKVLIRKKPIETTSSDADEDVPEPNPLEMLGASEEDEPCVEAPSDDVPLSQKEEIPEEQESAEENVVEPVVSSDDTNIIDQPASKEESTTADSPDVVAAATAAALGIPAAHARFLPQDINDEDEEQEEEIPVARTKTIILEDEEDEPVDELPAESEVTEAVGKPEIPSEPEMIIVNKADAEQAPIQHGDHIGLEEPYDQRAGHSNYQFPSIDLLIERPNPVVIDEAEQEANKELIVNAFRSYKIEIQRIEATIGPTVTLYEIVPVEGTRLAKIKSLEDDIAMSLAALGIRIIAPMPGKGTVGIEVPNRKAQIVSMRSMLLSPAFAAAKAKMNLPLALGSTISNEYFTADLSKMPHLLVAGATGQGKSVGLNCIITSLLYSKHPDELKFVLVDPKMVEFSLYQRIANQYLAKLPDEERAVITDPQKVVATLNSLCVEMDNRYELLSLAGVRDVKEYNARFMQRRLNPEHGHHFMPYIVMIVDEFADLIMTAGKDISVPIARIAQKARAVGMHMIIATQRPSTDIITGMIKSNFPARIAFKTAQGIDSKTILDRPGAHRLIGRGDMLALIDGRLERVQCALVETDEVEAICEHIGSQRGFIAPMALPEPPDEGGNEAPAEIGATTEEFRRCAMFISSQTQASITMMQRKFEIGFNKAGRYMDQMQAMGIVGPANGAKPRQVLMTPDEVQRLFE